MIRRLRDWLRPHPARTAGPADVVPPARPISVDSEDPLERAMAAVVWHTGGSAVGRRNPDGSVTITVRPPEAAE